MLESLAEKALVSKSRRLRFREVAPADCWELARAGAHPDFARYIDWTAGGDARTAFQWMQSRLMSDGPCHGQINLSAWRVGERGDEWAGIVRFYRSLTHTDGVQLHFGVWLAPHLWGVGGIALELGRLAIDTVWTGTTIPRLYARVVRQNVVSQRCLRHLGFVAGDSYTFDSGEREFDVRELTLDRSPHKVHPIETGRFRVAEPGRPRPTRAVSA